MVRGKCRNIEIFVSTEEYMIYLHHRHLFHTTFSCHSIVVANLVHSHNLAQHGWSVNRGKVRKQARLFEIGVDF